MLERLRRLFGPAPQLPAEAHVLAAHFKAHGFEVEPKSLKPGKPGIRAAFELRIAHYPLPLLVLSCADERAAERFVEDGGDRSSAFPTRNGRLVLYLPYWEPEDALTEPVIRVFRSFRA